MVQIPESITSPLVELTISDTPYGKRAFEIISDVLRTRRFLDSERDLREALFLARFRWLAFIEWDAHFRSKRSPPAYWPSSVASDVAEEQEDVLSGEDESQRSDLANVLSSRWAFPKTEVDRRFGHTTVAGLLKHRVCLLVSDACEKLEFIPLTRLRMIQRELQTPPRRKKADIISDLKSVVDASALGAMLGEMDRADYVLFGGRRALALAHWIRERASLVNLYLLTVRTFVGSVEQILTFGSERGGVYISVTEWPDRCRICGPYHLKKVTSWDRHVPPFHPGCTCNVLPSSLKHVFEK